MSSNSELIQSLIDYQTNPPVAMHDPKEISRHFERMNKLLAFVQQNGIHSAAQELIKADRNSCIQLLKFTEQTANAAPEYLVKAMEELLRTMTLNNVI